MKIRILLLFFLSLFLITCISTPKDELKKLDEYRALINKYNLLKYSKEQYYEVAEKYLDAVKTLLDSSNDQGKVNSYIRIIKNNYEKILDQALPAYTDDEKSISRVEKENAQQIKADIAVKDDYLEAEKFYNDALSFQKSKNYEKAIENFQLAEEKFSKCYSKAKEKLDKAKKSIESALDELKGYQEKIKKNTLQNENQVPSQ